MVRVNHADSFASRSSCELRRRVLPRILQRVPESTGDRTMQDGQAADRGTPGRSHRLCGLIDQVLASLSALFSRPCEAVNDNNDDDDDEMCWRLR